MSDNRKRIEAYIIKKLQAVNGRIVGLSNKLNYKGDSIFQSSSASPSSSRSSYGPSSPLTGTPTRRVP